MNLELKIKPSASKEGLSQTSEGLLVLSVRPPAVDGKANQRVIELLSELLKVPKRDIKILRGESCRLKLVQIDGVHSIDHILS